MSNNRQSELFAWKPRGDWKPDPNLPELSKFSRISMDTEYAIRGRKQYLAGLSIKTPDGQKRYLPVAHADGGNLDPTSVRYWAQRELRGKHLVGLNIGNDAEVMRAWDVDLEAQGNTLHDVAHAASLLNEYRRSGFSLDALGKEYTGREKMICPVDKDKIAESHSSMIGPYAEEDADLTSAIDEAQQPEIHRQELERVQALEDRLIWVNNHIERNGARLDLEKLNRWRGEVRAEYSSTMIRLYQSGSIVPMGFKPNAPKKWAKLFENLGLPAHYAEETGKESYDAAFLKTCEDPTIKLAVRAKQLNSILSKYLDKYAVKKSTRSGLPFMTGDILHFRLHQLRSKNDNEGGLEGADGTVSGRYSSADVNIQQVMKVKKQIKEFGMTDWIIRELFIPDDGYDYFAGDASQIEFRIFTHYSGDRDLIRAYKDDPNTDFYAAVGSLTGQNRDDAKITSLGKLYGMGIENLAGWLNLPCACGVGLKCRGCDLPENNWEHYPECGRCREAHDPDCPSVRAMDIAKTYDEKFPAAKKLARRVSKAAKQRGHVCTLLGRRQRFQGVDLHSFLNRLIQGSAADIFKMKLLFLYDNRNSIGIHKLRQPLHDEATGDIEKGEAARGRLQEAFNEITIQLKVPILWGIGFGNNWREARA